MYRSLGHVIWPRGSGDMTIFRQQHHCNDFFTFNMEGGINVKSHDS